MALELEYFNVIVPVATIRTKLGDDAYKHRFAAITAITWNDGYLFREGCMNPYELEDVLREWEEQGFELLGDSGGQKYWQDLCLVNSGYGPSYPCDWIEYDQQTNTVWLKGRPPGKAVGPAGREVAAKL